MWKGPARRCLSDLKHLNCILEAEVQTLEWPHRLNLGSPEWRQKKEICTLQITLPEVQTPAVRDRDSPSTESVLGHFSSCAPDFGLGPWGKTPGHMPHPGNCGKCCQAEVLQCKQCRNLSPLPALRNTCRQPISIFNRWSFWPSLQTHKAGCI